jgi:hypothetical protein
VSESQSEPGPDEQPRERFRSLPPRVPLDELVEEQDVDEARDPELGRDPDRDWLLRGS